jgi:Major Facilitator Superfamily
MSEVIANSDAPDVHASKAGFHPASLDAINFLLSDVRGALGPYLNVFLVTQQHWSQSQVGLVTTVSGLLGLSLQTPIGAAIDETHSKRGLIVLALAVLAIGATTIFAMPTFWPVAIANSFIALAGDVFGPAVAALTLGLYARKQLARRMGRNSAFDHAGNVAIALVAGVVGYAFSQRAVFLLVPVFSVLAGIAVLSIPAAAIDNDRARNLEEGSDASGGTPVKTAGYGVLFGSRPLVVFGLCVMLFHLANAAMLPLVGQKLAAAYPEEATAMMSACIVAAQLVMVPIAILVGRTADTWGRKPREHDKVWGGTCDLCRNTATVIWRTPHFVMLPRPFETEIDKRRLFRLCRRRRRPRRVHRDSPARPARTEHRETYVLGLLRGLRLHRRAKLILVRRIMRKSLRARRSNLDANRSRHIERYRQIVCLRPIALGDLNALENHIHWHLQLSGPSLDDGLQVGQQQDFGELLHGPSHKMWAMLGFARGQDQLNSSRTPFWFFPLVTRYAH